MRQFTPKEEDMIRKIISLKNKGGLGELQFGKLIREDLNSVAITWEVGEKSSISIYTTNSETSNKYYFNISDFLYFVDELANNNLIALDRFTDTSEKPERILYDSTKYTREIEGADISYIGDSITLFAICNNKEQKKFILLDTKVPKYNVQLANLFEKYANAIIYPLPLLIDIAENEFKDIEQRRFEEQIIKEKKNARRSFGAAICAIVVSAITPFLIMKCTPPIQISEIQLDSIKSAIKSVKSEFPNQIDVSLPDTITIKDIDQKPIINNI